MGVRNHPPTYLGSSLQCSVEARGLYKKREWIEREVACETVSEQAQPTILRDVSELLTLLWTLVFEAKHILKMMNHLMDEDGLFGRCAASLAIGQIDGSRGIVIHGDGIVLSG